MREDASESRVLVLAPTYKDGVITRDILGSAGCAAEVFRDIRQLCAALDTGAGVVLLTEDQLVKKEVFDAFCSTINRQPAWSDVPIVLLANGGADSPVAKTVLRWLRNVLVLERPVHIPTLISAIKSSLRSRDRQYELRDLLLELERSQEVLRQSEERHRLVTETMLQGIVYQDANGTIVSMNPAAERILGFGPDNFVGSSSVGQEPYTIREDGSPFPGLEHPAMVALCSGKPVSDVVMGIYNPELDARRWIRIDAIPLFRPGEDRPFQVYTVFDDFTERREAVEVLRRWNLELEQKVAERTAEVISTAEKLRAQRQRLFDVLETLPVIVSLTRPNYRVEFANRAYRDAFGDNQGRLCHESQFGREMPCEECQAFFVLRTGQPHQWEWELPDGRIFEIYNAPFTDTDGSQLILEMDVDITDRRQAERKLRDAHQDLERRAEQLRALASELSLTEQRERKRLALVLHDGLQQMLVATKFQLALIEKGKNVRKAAADVSNLIDDCIETSRSLTAELSPPVLHRGEFIPALEWLIQWMRDKHGLSVELRTEGQLAAAPDDVTVLLFQSVRELLFNIAKHAGTRAARVRISQPDGGLEIKVSDEGAGFDPGELEHRPTAGSGMGLFSIRERLNYIGGKMEIDSAPGRGTTFTLTVPVSTGSGQALEPAPEFSTSVAFANRRSPDQEDPSKVRIVLVDDHLVMRQGLAALLRSEPDLIIVGEASDGKSAIDLVCHTKPAVVLMDISMPGMDGIEATRKIREQLPDVKIIGLSMFQGGEQADAIVRAGAVGYVAKTGPSEAVLNAIRNCVQDQRPKSSKLRK